jgi:hypothetical protein
MSLPDPRRYGPGDAKDPLLALARAGDDARLVAALRERAASGADDEIRHTLSVAPDRDSYARLWRALCAAIEKPPADAAVATRVFAIPWVIVCAGSAPAVVSCVLPDVAALERVLQEHGVFGPSRNRGLSNALCSIEALEALAPSAVLRWAGSPARQDIAPAPISVFRGVEEVHVRFLPGAAVAPVHAPGIVETGANVGAWGTPVLRAMAARLATPGVQLLPMPRPPAGLYTAAHAGREAGIEAAFNLFVSNAARRFRMAVGDPRVTLSAHEAGEVRVTLWTPLDQAMVEGFRWPLHPADDLGHTERAIGALLDDCRLPQPEACPGILPAYTSTGAVFFPAR